MRRAQSRAELGDRFQIGAGGFGDGLRGSGIDGCEVDEVAAYTEGACSGAEEALGGFESDAAGGDEFEMRERSEQRLEVAGAAYG
jgi:hypothetical protein